MRTLDFLKLIEQSVIRTVVHITEAPVREGKPKAHKEREKEQSDFVGGMPHNIRVFTCWIYEEAEMAT